MPMVITAGDAVTLILMLGVAGLVAGFLSGLLGIGGGGVLVPVLYEAFGFAGATEDVRMHLALGTTLAVIAPTVVRSLLAHRARGAVDLAVILRMAPWVVLGVGLGSVIANGATSETLRWIWVVFGTALALKMAYGGDEWKIASELPGAPWLQGVSFAIGIVSTLMGIGGATFSVPFLTLHGWPLIRAVATATGIGGAIAIPGLIGYMVSGWGEPSLPPYSLGYVSLGALLIAPLSVMAAPMGVRLAHGVPKRTLELAFAAFLISVVVRFLISLIG